VVNDTVPSNPLYLFSVTDEASNPDAMLSADSVLLTTVRKSCHISLYVCIACATYGLLMFVSFDTAKLTRTWTKIFIKCCGVWIYAQHLGQEIQSTLL